MDINELKRHYQEATIKFIWQYSDIKEYLDVIEQAISDTVHFLQKICDKDVNHNDIRGIIIQNDHGDPSKLLLFIKNKKIDGLGTVFSNFKEQYKILATGRDDRIGFGLPSNNPEKAINFLKSIGHTDEQAQKKWDYIQSFKRKITTFDTLANKSLNRSRRVPPKLRFQVLSRDNFKCRLCGTGADQAVLHVDHIKPVLKSGKNDLNNLMTLCRDCNLGKGSISFEEWFFYDSD